MGNSQAYPQRTRPLVLCGDMELLDELLRVCAAAGLEPDVAPEPGASGDSWQAAPLVLVGDDVADSLARAIAADRLQRRRHVVLVSRRSVSDETAIWRLGVGIGAAYLRFLPGDEPQVVEHLLAATESAGRQAPVVGVLGGRGGAGVSTLAIALAVAAVRRHQEAVVLDTDPCGAGLDVLLGLADSPHWADFSGSPGRLPPAAFRDEFRAAAGHPTVVGWGKQIRFDLPGDLVRAVVEGARRASDLVVVDLPRSREATGLEMTGAVSTLLLLVPADVASCAAAARAREDVGQVCDDVRLVVRADGRGRLAPEAISEALDLPLAGCLRSEPAVRRAWDRGEPPGRHPGALARSSDRLLDAVLGPRMYRTAAR